ncbi:MAG: bifunctional UDP-N-acetylmuramoyl-tripeptide:D-alanyl-D-alanine ligase/alanine racemase [Bacteroidales bacterium]|nr:bifunctional UDP-N-acetylmuramoyl-tripeptide:D-alanyl-D-alanine ligase/alanine racemase [Bacteroidales bacterium]
MFQEKFKISEIVAIVKGILLTRQSEDAAIIDILVDSRTLFKTEATLFFALQSKRNDGHKYIEELYNKGLRSFVISNPDFDIQPFPEADFILVKNSLNALQSIAAAHRKKFNIPVIGITGSNGKTIIKEWLYQLLSPGMRVVRSPKSYNSQIGVPLSVWQLESTYQAAIFEAGISEPEEMSHLQKIINPTVGIFTNIGEAHNENFISRQQKVGEKLKLFTKVDTLIYCSDHREVQEVIIRSEILENIRSFTWSRKEPATLQITKTERKEKTKTEIAGFFNAREISITIPFIDEASIENSIHCWAALLHLGINQEIITERMLLLVPIAMRLELIEGINNCTVINDSYNSDVISLGIALDFLSQHAGQKQKTVILSDVLQSGRSEIYLYGKIAEMLRQKQVKRLIGIGPAISRQAEQFDLQKEFYQTTDEFLRSFSFTKFQNEGILLKGARIFEFEQISQALQQKAHETVFEINLNALIHNLNFYRSKLKPSTKLMAMVKASSYGYGGFEIANALQFHKADYLAVAYADEALELRRAGINLPIMVMNPDEESMDSIIAYNLEPEIYSFRVLDMLENAIRRNIIPRNKPVKIHLKLDTGMHRLGFCDHETGELIRRVKANPRIYVESIFTHLAATDNREQQDFTRYQISLFEKVSDRIIGEINYPVLRHVLNTAGISAYPEAQFDMVRLGIGLYGISPIEAEQQELQNVSSLKSTISQLKQIKQDETIGYNRAGIALQDMLVATVPVGYADGLSRRLSNGRGHLVVKERLVPIVGNVCMDMCMIDVTGLDVKEGEEVIIFDNNHSIMRLAEEMDTIPYEVMTAISKRVKRVYFQE